MKLHVLKPLYSTASLQKLDWPEKGGDTPFPDQNHYKKNNLVYLYVFLSGTTAALLDEAIFSWKIGQEKSVS